MTIRQGGLLARVARGGGAAPPPPPRRAALDQPASHDAVPCLHVHDASHGTDCVGY
jgi:hypothetical protein